MNLCTLFCICLFSPISGVVYDMRSYKIGRHDMTEYDDLYEYYKQNYYDNYLKKNPIKTFTENDNYNYDYNYNYKYDYNYSQNNSNSVSNVPKQKRSINYTDVPQQTHNASFIEFELLSNEMNTFQNLNNIDNRRSALIADLLYHYQMLQYAPLIFESRKPYNIHSQFHRTFLTWVFNYNNIYYTKYYNKILKIGQLLDFAFKTWEQYIPLNFSQIDDRSIADIYISFEQGDHGDNSPFDGRHGVLAHASFPDTLKQSYIHFDLDEDWSFKLHSTEDNNENFFLETALHEIGHTLGLEHNAIPFSIMAPFASRASYYKRNHHISNHDIRNIQYFYGSVPQTYEKLQKIMLARQIYEDSEERIYLEFKKKRILDRVLSKLEDLKMNWVYEETPNSMKIDVTKLDTDLEKFCSSRIDSFFFIDGLLHFTKNEKIWRQSESSKVEFLLSKDIKTYFAMNLTKTSGMYKCSKTQYISVYNEKILQKIDMETLKVINIVNVLKIKTLSTQFLADETNIYALLQNNSLIKFNETYPIRHFEIINLDLPKPNSIKTLFIYLKYFFFITDTEFYIYDQTKNSTKTKKLDFQPWLNCGPSSVEFNDMQKFFDSNLYKEIFLYK